VDSGVTLVLGATGEIPRAPTPAEVVIAVELDRQIAFCYDLTCHMAFMKLSSLSRLAPGNPALPWLLASTRFASSLHFAAVP